MVIREEQEPFVPNQDAEAFLIELGVFKRPAEERRKYLGCIGCKLCRGGEGDAASSIYGYEIGKCNSEDEDDSSAIRARASAACRLLQSLVEADIMVAEYETLADDETGPRRKLHTFADTLVAKQLAAELDVPPFCRLDLCIAE